MAIQSKTINQSRYLPPGAYVTEEPVQPIPGFTGLPRQVCLIGEGDPNKIVVNERKVRGYITDEPVVPTSGGVIVANYPTDQKKTTFVVKRNGDALDPSKYTLTDVVPTSAPTYTTPAGSIPAGTYSYLLCFEVNGVISSGLAFDAVLASSGNISLAAIPTFAYGSAKINGDTVTVRRRLYRSKKDTPEVYYAYASPPLSDNSTTTYVDSTLDGALSTAIDQTILNGLTIVTLSNDAYDSSDVYTISYQSLTREGNGGNRFDKLVEDTRDLAATVLRVGSFAGTNSFDKDVDYQLRVSPGVTLTVSGNDVTASGSIFTSGGVFRAINVGDYLVVGQKIAKVLTITDDDQATVDDSEGGLPAGSQQAFYYMNGKLYWKSAAAASLTGSVAPGTVTYSGSETLKLTIGNGAEVTVSPTSGSKTASQLATSLNSQLTSYGVGVTDSGGYIVLTTTAKGKGAIIEIGSGSLNDSLGFIAGQRAVGSGRVPAQGEEYYVSYKAKRPSTDFNRPIISTSYDAFVQKVGPVSSTNALALAGQMVFEQSPPFIYHIQVQNTGTGLAAQDLDYIEAIKGAELNAELTDIIVLGHPTANGGGKKASIRAALREHVENMSSLQNRAERIGWFGMPVNTAAGDGETPGTFVYVATQELQVSADSPARGRFVLTGPSWVKKTYRFADGTVKQFTLDSTYLAAAVAARNAGFLGPAEGLLRKEIFGLDAAETLSRGDRDYMASNGVNLLVPKAGRNLLFDPVTTDLSSAEFREINVMNQKDNVVKRVRKAVDDQVVGIVPDDLAQFIIEVKSVIATQLASAVADGAIAPFQNDDGTVRNISLADDIVVEQRASDPTTYDFAFAFFVRFTAKRLFGTFSVRVPSGV